MKDKAQKQYNRRLLWRFTRGSRLAFLLCMAAGALSSLADMLSPQIIRTAVDNVLGGSDAPISPLLRPLMQVGAATTPLALIILGASFRRGGISESRRGLWACVFIRLIAAPALVLTAAALLGFRGVEFVTLLAIFATPCAVASYAMAQQMGSDAALAGNTVVFTSALSCFTIFGWIFLTKTLGLF